MPPPNFITECFFMIHILINMVHKKIEQQYEQLGKAINEAGRKKDLATFEEYMGIKMCYDAHVTGKNTLAGFRSFFTFTGCMFIVLNNSQEYLSKKNQLAEIFDNIESFQSKVVSLPTLEVDRMPLDLAALPSLILTNLSHMPRLFRQMNSESYYGKDVDLHI